MHGSSPAAFGSERIDDLRLIVEAVPIAIVIADNVGRIVLVNTEAEQLFGFPRDTLLESHIEALIPQRFRDGHPTLRDRYFARPQRRPIGAGRDLFGLRSDGVEVPIEIGLNPVVTADGNFVLATIVDISDRIRAEEHLRLVMEAGPNAMVSIDMRGAITLMNAQAEELFGYTRSELIGQSVEMLVPERFRGAHGAMRRDYFEAPMARPMGPGRELFGLRKDGSEVPIVVGLTPSSSPDGSKLVLAAITDITEHKRAEELGLINAGMQVHNTALEALNTELESFSYSISHDLRAPVRAIKGYAEILAREHAEALGAEGHRLLGIVQDESARMGALIDDLLKFSALGTKQVASHPVDMTAVAREAANEQRAAAQNGLDLSVDELPSVSGDRALLHQVWTNLISNAVKYSTGRSPAVVRVTGRVEGAQAIFRVEDNGVGFNMKYYDKLFGVFQRLHHADEFPGTGVGLAIVQRIVARHDGRVWAQGTPGEGAVFSFSLPTGGSP